MCAKLGGGDDDDLVVQPNVMIVPYAWLICLIFMLNCSIQSGVSGCSKGLTGVFCKKKLRFETYLCLFHTYVSTQTWVLFET